MILLAPACADFLLTAAPGGRGALLAPRVVLLAGIGLGLYVRHIFVSAPLPRQRLSAAVLS